MILIKQNEAFSVTVILAAGGTPVTGLGFADVQAYLSKQGNAPAAFTLTGTNFTELSAANMPGLYVIDLLAADTASLGSLVMTFSDPLDAGTFDQYAISAQVYTNLFDDISSQVSAVNANLGSFSSSLAAIQGGGFVSGTDSLKALSDSMSTNITGPVALQEQLVGAGGTTNAPVGVGLWDVLGDGSTTLPGLGEQLVRLLGLNHENFALRDQIYDADNNLVSASAKLYPTKGDVLADTNATTVYSIAATYNGVNQLTSYTMVIEP
jgi:hypothetical protein